MPEYYSNFAAAVRVWAGAAMAHNARMAAGHAGARAAQAALAPPAPQEPTVTITRFRKRPIEVDTIQWTGDNEAEVQAFADGASHFYALDAEDRANCDDPDATATVHDRLHSTWVLVFTGQHIVRGVKGELYPIAEDVLAETYEPVSEAS